MVRFSEGNMVSLGLMTSDNIENNFYTKFLDLPHDLGRKGKNSNIPEKELFSNPCLCRLSHSLFKIRCKLSFILSTLNAEFRISSLPF